jgi:hypothetical protein
MPLVKSPAMTPRKLAANRANGRRSGGPRTYAGRYKGVLNALKHGRYSQAFRSNLLKVGEDVALYDWIWARFRESFQPVGKRQWRENERLARETWCLLRKGGPERDRGGRPLADGVVWSVGRTPWRQGGSEAEPHYIVKAGLTRIALRSCIRIEGRSAFRLMFWVRRSWRKGAIRLPLSTCAMFGDWLMEIALVAAGLRRAWPEGADGAVPLCLPPAGRG